MYKLWCSPCEADDGKSRQESVPEAENTSQLIPRPIGHQNLSAEYQYHVDAAEVEPICPILCHPDSRILMLELFFKVEHI